MRPTRFAWLLLLAVDAAQAVAVLELADGQSAPVRVSAHALTRIAMADGGRVAKVIGIGSEVAVQPDEEAGQVFIRPAPGQSAAFTLHVRDTDGATYTLLVMPSDIPGGTVFIRRAGAHREVDAPPPGVSRVSRIKHWLRVLEQGGVPEGAVLERLDEPVPWRPQTRLRRTGRAAGQGWKVDLYLLRNVSDQELHLAEAEFRELGVGLLAIALRSRRLTPGQRTRLFVLQTDE